MKALNQICMALCLLMGLASCEMREEILGKPDSQGTGLLRLSVEAIAPKVQTKAAVVTDDFEVSIAGVSDEVKDFTKDLGKAGDLPEFIELAVGTYNVVAHTPGELEKQMDHPYYLGNEELQIVKDDDKQADVHCKMRNSRIELNYTAEFLAAFQSWTITLDDGSDIAYSIKHDNTVGEHPKPGYYDFGENGAEYVTLNIDATTVTGNRIHFSQPYYKKDAETGYDETKDDPNFKGGDALLITLKPQAPDAPTSGTVGIDVTVSVLFSDSETPVDIEVSDKNQTPDPGTDPDPKPEGEEPSMVLPAGGTYSTTKIPADLNAILKAPAGLESATVRIETSNADFKGILSELPFDKKPGDLLTGADLVNNSSMQELFNGIGGDNPKQTPQKGETEYEFPISAFSTFLGAFVGTHTFYLELTDVNGKVATGSLTLTITE